MASPTVTTTITNKEAVNVRGLKKERAKARWSILRSTLLHKAQSSTRHSIHRFPGYQLLKPLPQREVAISHVAQSLKEFIWDQQETQSEVLDRLEIAVLALGSYSPKGCCMLIKQCPKDDESWVEILKTKCHRTLNLLVVNYDQTMGSATLLVQEGSSTKYKCCQYMIDDTCSLLTREPRETRLSLEELVSHRTTGIDNTGNICVWDSERTLAYLLYHHFQDFPILPDLDPGEILELGTGMAGLAGVSLGLNLVQARGKEASQQKNFNISLTDGHADGVKNNKVNQHLTKLFSGTKDHPYQDLTISSNVLLWTTDCKSSLEMSQDIVLVSDCTHFQNFHAALAITTLRSLRIGGAAVFCQPNRGDSLSNFCSLLEKSENLLSLHWWTHPIVEDNHKRAEEQHPGVYDKNLHYPKIMLVTKLRDLTEEDCKVFLIHQERREL